MEYPDTVTQQPSSDTFGMGLKGNPDNLPGLQMLSHVKEMKVKQRHPGCLELLGCWEYKNKYDVMDMDGSKIFYLEEESDCLCRMCCANARALQASFQDLAGNELLRFDRPLRCQGACCGGCYPNWTQVLTVYHQDQELGKIREVPICCWSRKHLEVWDKNEQKIYDISGPICPISCGGDVAFPIENAGGIAVGEIAKQWRGFCAEALTDTDTFRIEFPDNIDVTQKALLVGATMLVDYMFFEKKDNDNGGS